MIGRLPRQAFSKLVALKDVRNMSLQKMSAQEVNSTLVRFGLPWQHQQGEKESICKHYQYDDFVSAFGVMTIVGQVAEEMAHHPDWYNVYNNLKINLNTHDAQGITLKDFALAVVIEQVSNQQNIPLKELSMEHPLWPELHQQILSAINAHL